MNANEILNTAAFMVKNGLIDRTLYEKILLIKKTHISDYTLNYNNKFFSKNQIFSFPAHISAPFLASLENKTESEIQKKLVMLQSLIDMANFDDEGEVALSTTLKLKDFPMSLVYYPPNFTFLSYYPVLFKFKLKNFFFLLTSLAVFFLRNFLFLCFVFFPLPLF
jgi:hypothetical protein